MWIAAEIEGMLEGKICLGNPMYILIHGNGMDVIFLQIYVVQMSLKMVG